MSGSNGNGTKPDDMDAIVAAQFGDMIINGVRRTVVPVTPKTQRYGLQLNKQMEAGDLDLTVGERNAKIAIRCLRPQPTEEEADEIPIAVLDVVLARAMRGIKAMDRLMADQAGGPEKNEDAPAPTAPNPTS